jgi:hypothetical protein
MSIPPRERAVDRPIKGYPAPQHIAFATNSQRSADPQAINRNHDFVKARRRPLGQTAGALTGSEPEARVHLIHDYAGPDHAAFAQDLDA